MSRLRAIARAPFVVVSGVVGQPPRAYGPRKGEPLQPIQTSLPLEHASFYPRKLVPGRLPSLRTRDQPSKVFTLMSSSMTTRKPSVLVFNTSSSSPARRFESALRRIAESSIHHRYRHAAMVIKAKKVWAIACNDSKKHAEQKALKVAGSRARGATLYTLMVRRDGSLGKGIPCGECFAYAKRQGIHKIVVYC